MEGRITLDYGSGGSKTSELISSILLPAFDNPALAQLGDGAVLSGAGQLVFSTDSFVVSPWRFPGGDIGKLSVCGTVNDLCMAGGRPQYLSLSFILEEGFLFSDLEQIVESIAREAREAGVSIVTGDTKVVDEGCRFRQRRRDLYQYGGDRIPPRRFSRTVRDTPGRRRPHQRQRGMSRSRSHDGAGRPSSGGKSPEVRLPFPSPYLRRSAGLCA